MQYLSSYRDSWHDYFSFMLAKSFHYTDDPNKEFPPSAVEQLSRKVLAPLQVPVDVLLANITEPVMIIAIGVAGVAATTVVFYPDLSFQLVHAVCSPFIDFEPWMMKFATFCVLETGLNLLAIRTIMRYRNKELRAAWENRTIVPIHMGSRLHIPTDRA